MGPMRWFFPEFGLGVVVVLMLIMVGFMLFRRAMRSGGRGMHSRKRMRRGYLEDDYPANPRQATPQNTPDLDSPEGEPPDIQEKAVTPSQIQEVKKYKCPACGQLALEDVGDCQYCGHPLEGG